MELETFKLLEPEEVYVYYDMPLLYSATDKAGILYLIYWFGPLLSGEEEWLVAKIGEDLQALEEGDMDLLYFWESRRDIWIVTDDLMGEPDICRTILLNELDGQLPEEGVTLL